MEKSECFNHSAPQTTLPSKPGPKSLNEVTNNEVKKTQFLTSSSTLDHLLSECNNLPVGIEVQNNLPKVAENELTKNDLGRDISPPPGFSRKYGPNSASVAPKGHLLPSHQHSSIFLGGETQEKSHLPHNEPNNKAEPNSAKNISLTPSFSNKNGPGGAIVEIIDLTEDCDERKRVVRRTHSLPHPKHGPYKCPECLTIHQTSQHYAAHVSANHRSEIPGEKRKRRFQRLKNKKYKMVQCPEGLTMVQDQSSKASNNEVQVVPRCTIRNGVTINEKDDGKVIKTREESVGASQRPSIRDNGKRPAPEQWKDTSSPDYKRNPNWKGPFGYLKRTKPN